MKTIILLLITVLIQACSFTTPSYQVSAASQQALAKAENKITVVNEKTDIYDLDSIGCRAAGSVSLPDDEPFVDYVVRALKSELQSAGKLDDNGKKLYARIKRIDFSSRMGSTSWHIDAEYRIDNKTIPVATVYSDRSSFAAVSACNNVARYFTKAVETHLAQLYQDPSFKDALGAIEKSVKSDVTIEDKLRQLNKLHSDGLISDEEYANKKQELLNAL